LIRFLPPLNVSDADLEEALEIIEEVLDEWHGIEPSDD
jgi:4-aminobutyrate aminotransferase-like enzyme